MWSLFSICYHGFRICWCASNNWVWIPVMVLGLEIILLLLILIMYSNNLSSSNGFACSKLPFFFIYIFLFHRCYLDRFLLQITCILSSKYVFNQITNSIFKALLTMTSWSRWLCKGFIFIFLIPINCFIIIILFL